MSVCQLDCTGPEDLTERDSIPGNPNRELLNLGCTSVRGVTSTGRTSGRKIRANLSGGCSLLHERFFPSQGAGQRGLTHQQHLLPCVLTPHSPMLDLGIYSLRTSEKRCLFTSLRHVVPCINKS